MPRQRASACDPIASASPMCAPRATGCSSRISCARIASSCSAGPMAASRCCGRCGRISRQATSGRIFAPLRYSIRAAAGWAIPPGARRVPTLILLGALDDWAPAKNCEQMVAGARGRSARAVDRQVQGRASLFRSRECAGPAAAQCRLRPGRLRPRDGRHQSGSARGRDQARPANGSRAKTTFPARPDALRGFSFGAVACRRLAPSAVAPMRPSAEFDVEPRAWH